MCSAQTYLPCGVTGGLVCRDDWEKISLEFFRRARHCSACGSMWRSALRFARLLLRPQTGNRVVWPTHSDFYTKPK